MQQALLGRRSESRVNTQSISSVFFVAEFEMKIESTAGFDCKLIRVDCRAKNLINVIASFLERTLKFCGFRFPIVPACTREYNCQSRCQVFQSSKSTCRLVCATQNNYSVTAKLSKVSRRDQAHHFSSTAPFGRSSTQTFTCLL